MAGLLLYVATFSFIPIFIGYFAIFFIKKEKLITDGKIDSNVLIIIFIILLTALNKVLGFNKENTVIEILPETSLMILMYWLAIAFDNKLVKIIIYLTVIEIIVVVIEYSLNVTSFAPDLKREFVESELLYDSRPYGLSANTSVIALKIFLSTLLLFRFNVFTKRINFYIVLSFLFVGMILTFNRTVIIANLVFLLLFALKNFKLTKKGFAILILFFVIGMFLMINYQEVLFNQMTRGREGVNILSGRAQIWERFFSFIKNHIFFGNNSYKLYIDVGTSKAHAHSSYLQIFATHGIIISLLYMILVIRNINIRNYIYVIPILIFSLTQYGIFWGFSITDIVLFVFLFNNKTENDRLFKRFN